MKLKFLPFHSIKDNLNYDQYHILNQCLTINHRYDDSTLLLLSLQNQIICQLVKCYEKMINKKSEGTKNLINTFYTCHAIDTMMQ